MSYIENLRKIIGHDMIMTIPSITEATKKTRKCYIIVISKNDLVLTNCS